MATSNRELILQSFKAALENVKTINGFDNTVTKVERMMLAWDDPQTTPPVLMVLGGTETYDDRFDRTTVSGMKVRIRGYSKSVANPEVALNSLIRDVQIVLNDSTYNSAYYKTYRPISLDCDEGWLNMEVSGFALFELVIEVIYKFSRDSP